MRYDMKNVNILSVVCISWLVSGCYSHQSPVTGTTIHHNLAVQIINPEPAPKPQVVKTSGIRIAGAIQRYNDGKVIQPTTLKLRKSSSTSN